LAPVLDRGLLRTRRWCCLPARLPSPSAVRTGASRDARRWNDLRMAVRDTVGETPGSTQAWSPRLALLVAATFFMEFLDGTVLTTAIPNIADDFKVPAADVSITMTAYLLTAAMGIPVSGWLAERFGARRVFCLAIAMFTLASLACSLSQDLTALTLSRIMQGFGGAMMVPVGTLLVLRGTPKAELLTVIEAGLGAL